MSTGKVVQDQNLERQMGCMAGFLQLFDRHQILTGKRLYSTKRLPPTKVTFYYNAAKFFFFFFFSEEVIQCIYFFLVFLLIPLVSGCRCGTGVVGEIFPGGFS